MNTGWILDTINELNKVHKVFNLILTSIMLNFVFDIFSSSKTLKIRWSYTDFPQKIRYRDIDRKTFVNIVKYQ